MGERQLRPSTQALGLGMEKFWGVRKRKKSSINRQLSLYVVIFSSAKKLPKALILKFDFSTAGNKMGKREEKEYCDWI